MRRMYVTRVMTAKLTAVASDVKSRCCTHFGLPISLHHMPVFRIRSRHDVPLYLAPMAGVSESPFRRLCRRFGADVVVTEFLSAEGIRRENQATLAKLRVRRRRAADRRADLRRRPGRDGARRRALVTDVFQPEFIDINFGCPVKKVVRRNGGSGCLRDLDLVQTIIRAVAAATHLPVTVKIRSGWNEEMRDPVEDRAALPGCGRAGARAARRAPARRCTPGTRTGTRSPRVMEALEIPVIGNGDIKTAEDALRMRQQTGCAGVMIARGSFGQPWIFRQARALLDGAPDAGRRPACEERFEIALEHARMVQDYEHDPGRRGASSSASTSAGT